MKTTYNLLTYDEAVAICDGLIFYQSTTMIDGYKVCTFNYRLANYANFVEHQAWEMRGMSFVFNTDGSLYKRFLLMNKFFNLNQVAETQLDLIKDIEIESNYFKEDGSVISFIQLPNGRILAKSKMETTSTQAVMAMQVYDNSPAIQRFVKHCLDNDLICVFELVSPKNRIVLKYMATDLILLRVRDNVTGEYINVDTFGSLLDGIKRPENLTTRFANWTEITDYASTAEGLEGGVVQLVTGQLVKWKCAWYCDLHNLLTDVIGREDYLLDQVFAETIDDLIAEVDPSDTETLDTINDVIDAVQNYMKIGHAQVDFLINQYYTTYKEDRKAWATALKGEFLFGETVGFLFNEKPLYDVLVSHVKRNTYRLEEARTFVRKYKPQPILNIIQSIINFKTL